MQLTHHAALPDNRIRQRIGRIWHFSTHQHPVNHLPVQIPWQRLRGKASTLMTNRRAPS